MTTLSRKAEQQLDAFRSYYEIKERPEATRKLIAALENAIERIGNNPKDGLPFPRPYPDLAEFNYLWIKAHVYWFSYQRLDSISIITGIFYDRSNIPRLLAS